MRSSILSLATLLAATSSLFAMAQRDATDGQDPNCISCDLSLRTATDLGCFSSPGNMVDMGIYTFQAVGWCQPLCVRQSKTYFALVNGTNCFCGNAPPSNQFKVSAGNCNVNCTGFDRDYCGGTNYWDVQNANFRNGDPTGTQVIKVPPQTYTYTGPVASSTTVGASTVIITQSATADAVVSPTSSSTSSSGPNTAAIVAGVVVAIVLVVAIAGGIFFFNRRRKQRALAEEQRRHEMMTSMVTREKPGSGYTSPDSRLDPSLMFQRRLSDGSIRDNEDYSRRILKVANPDD